MSLVSFAKRMQTDPGLVDAMKVDPVGTINIAAAAEVPNTLIYQIATIVIGVIGIACVGGIIALAVLGRTPSEALVSLASAMGGGLVGILMPTQKT